MPVDVLISGGIVGLDKAIRKFNPDRGVAPSTYLSWWIHHDIMQESTRYRNPIHIPRSITDNQRRRERGLSVNRKDMLSQEQGEWLQVIHSLDHPAHTEDAEESVVDTVPHGASGPDTLWEQRELHQALVEAIEQLPVLEQRTIMRYFGLYNGDSCGTGELAKREGNTRACQSFRLRRALKRLRTMPELQAWWGI